MDREVNEPTLQTGDAYVSTQEMASVIDGLHARIRDLEIENARCRYALRHYANHKNWAVGPTSSPYAWVYVASHRRADHYAKDALGKERVNGSG